MGNWFYKNYWFQGAKKQFKFLFLISDIHLQSFTTICGTDDTNDSLFYHKNLLAI